MVICLKAISVVWKLNSGINLFVNRVWKSSQGADSETPRTCHHWQCFAQKSDCEGSLLVAGDLGADEVVRDEVQSDQAAERVNSVFKSWKWDVGCGHWNEMKVEMRQGEICLLIFFEEFLAIFDRDILLQHKRSTPLSHLSHTLPL